MGKIRSWFYDSENSSESSSEDEEKAGEEQWEAVNRAEKKKQKKERQRIRNEKLQKETAEKASLTIGIGPITKDTISHFEDIENDAKKAKEAAVKEFLGFYLKYGDKEIEELEIKAMQIAPKDNIMYVALADKKDVKVIYVRASQCKHEEVTTRNFIPPQFYKRYMFLSRKCADARKESENKSKTQIRFSKNDIEVMTKMKGSSEGYKVIQLSEICDVDDIPKFDNNIKWRKKSSRQHQDRLNESSARGQPPSMNRATQHVISRSNSLNEAPRKKLKTSNLTSKFVNDGNGTESSGMSGNIVN